MVVPNPSGASPGRGVGCGDMGRRFRDEWKEVDLENWKWLRDHRINPRTGLAMAPVDSAAGGEGGVRRRARAGSIGTAGGAAGTVVRRGGGWFEGHKMWVGVIFLVAWVFLARSLE